MDASTQPVTPPTSQDPLIGSLVAGKYRIQRVIAAGGMGRVYQADQEPISRPVAIKVIAPPRDDTEGLDTHAKRFFREASLLGRLSHPNIVVVYDYGTIDTSAYEHPYYLVMEYLEGRTLREVIQQEAPLPLPRVLRIGLQLCGALHDAHAQGVLHRDLKPPNIILTQRGGDPDFVKLIDFGLVKEINPDKGDEVTSAQNLVGSPLYMAPEQFTKNQTIVQSEIYSVGVILYEMICGRTPFVRSADSTVSDLIIKHVMAPPPPIEELIPDHDIPDALREAVMCCLAKKPEERFASLVELQEVMDACYRELLSGDYPSLSSSLSMRMRNTGDFPTVDPRTPSALAADTGSLRILQTNASFLTPSAMRRAAAAPVLTEQPTYAPSEPAPAPKSKGPLLIALVALLVAGGVLTVLLLKRDPQPMASAAAPAAPQPDPTPVAQPDPTPVAQPDPTPPLPLIVTLTIETTPSGAVVLDGEQRLGETPLTLPIERASLSDERPRVLTLRKPGYLDQTLSQGATQEATLTHQLTLAAAPKTPQPPPTQKKPIKEPTAPATNPPPPINIER